MTARAYRVSPICAREGHLMEWDASLPTCTREGCDEGMQVVDRYLDQEAAECTCQMRPDGQIDQTGCNWHREWTDADWLS